MPFNDMTVRWVDILGQLARSIATVGYLSYQIPRRYHVPHLLAIRTGEFLTPQSGQIPQRPEELRLCH